MEYLFSFLLFALNLADYEMGINKILFFGASLVLFSLMAYVIFGKTRDFLCTSVALLCHTWPYSWVNIFGDPSYASVEITWFYLTGLFILMFALFNIRKIKDKNVNAVILGVFAALCIIFVYPLLISPSITEGLKEFIMIGFFIILTFIAFLCSDRLDEEKRRHIISAYIYSAAVSSVFIIIQSALYLLFGETLFKFTIGTYFGNTMISAKLLMEDTSCSTIMLGAAIFYMLERFNRKDRRVFYAMLMAVTMVGMAFTTRRTSIISLIVCLVLYIPVYYKGTLKKLTMFLLISGFVGIMIFYLVFARPVDSYSQLIDENGRLNDYLNALNLFFNNPLGIGYDDNYLFQVMDRMIPHNTVLRWLNMGGIIFTVLMVSVLVYTLGRAYKTGQKDDFWAMFYCLFAMNFIPDILSARFFVVICMTVFLSRKREKNDGLLIKHNFTFRKERKAEQ